MKTHSFFILMFSLLFYVACDTIHEEPYLEIINDKITVDSNGTNMDIPISTNQKITAESNTPWVDCQLSYTDCEVTLRLSIQENDTNDSREAIITVTANDIKKQILVIQEQNDNIELEQEQFIVDYKEQDLIIPLVSNTKYEVSIPEDWLTYLPNSKEMLEDQIILHLTENKGLGCRKSAVELRYGKSKQIVTIQQDAKGQIILDEETIKFGPSRSESKFKLVSNVDHQISLDADWCHYNIDKEDDYHFILTISADKNTTYSDRTCKLRITAGEIIITRTIFQAENTGLIIEETEKTIDYRQQNFSIHVSSNLTFNVRSTVEWIKHVDTKSLTSSECIFNVEELTDLVERQGSIEFYNENGTLASLKVVQQPADVLMTEDSILELSPEGGLSTCKITSNVHYTTSIADNCDWLTSYRKDEEIQTEQIFKYEPNNSGIDRETTVTLTYKTLECKIQLSQPFIDNLILQETETSMYIGENLQLNYTAHFHEISHYEGLTWESSNPNVASVDTNGNIKGLSKGITTITLSTADLQYKTSCVINIEDIIEHIYVKAQPTKISFGNHIIADLNSRIFIPQDTSLKINIESLLLVNSNSNIVGMSTNVDESGRAFFKSIEFQTSDWTEFKNDLSKWFVRYQVNINGKVEMFFQHFDPNSIGDL